MDKWHMDKEHKRGEEWWKKLKVEGGRGQIQKRRGKMRATWKEKEYVDIQKDKKEQYTKT